MKDPIIAEACAVIYMTRLGGVSLDRIHPWLSTPEALESAHKALQIPRALMGAKAQLVSDDELFPEALAILTECAAPSETPMPRAAARSGAHIGSMWKWPQDEMSKWAVREVGYSLNNYLRTRGRGHRCIGP